MKGKTLEKNINRKLKRNNSIVTWKWWWTKSKICCINSHIYTHNAFSIYDK